jgi:hypothetical protein
MRDEHVIELLESAPLARLTEGETERLRAHTARCEGCRRAYEAAQVASALLRARVAQVCEPSPFFQTRVLAALRERRAEEGPVLVRLWRAAGSLVSSMAASVAVLAVVTFAVPALYTLPDAQETAVSASDPYATESILIASDDASEQMNYEQVLSTVYGGEEAEGVDGPNR